MSQHKAKKRFGQNFLVDQSIIDALIISINPLADDLMVEIGPGLGAITKPLLQALNHLHVVEFDRDIIQWMQANYQKHSIEIHDCDALKFDFGALGPELRVVGNLPYNISTPILFHLIAQLPNIKDMHFMLQKEVVERMVAEPSTSAYGRLSVMLQYHLEMHYLHTVPADAFKPAPKVESAFVCCIPFAEKPYIAADEVLLSTLVQQAFNQRRKTIRNTLKSRIDATGLEALGIDPQSRAENLSVQDFVAITNHLS